MPREKIEYNQPKGIITKRGGEINQPQSVGPIKLTEKQLRLVKEFVDSKKEAGK